MTCHCSPTNQSNVKWSKNCIPRVSGASAQQISPQINARATEFVPLTSTLYVATNKPVLLPTAPTEVYALQDSCRALRVKVILDTGSQCSYVTSKTKNALILKKEIEQCMVIATFGSVEPEVQKCDVVQLGMKMCVGGSLMIETYVIPVICALFTAQRLIVLILDLSLIGASWTFCCNYVLIQ